MSGRVVGSVLRHFLLPCNNDKPRPSLYTYTLVLWDPLIYTCHVPSHCREKCSWHLLLENVIIRLVDGLPLTASAKFTLQEFQKTFPTMLHNVGFYCYCVNVRTHIKSNVDKLTYIVLVYILNNIIANTISLD